DDRVAAMTVDPANRVVVTGTSQGDYTTITFSSAGVLLWTNRYDRGDDGASAVATDSSGNVFVTGGSDFGTGPDWATVKYSSSGSELWANHYNGRASSDGYPQAVAVDGSGNVIVTGYSYGNGSYQDYATIKYSSAGVALWTNRYNGPANGTDEAVAVAVDSSGNVFVTGHSQSSSADYFTIAYSSAGSTLWSRRYNGSANANDLAYAMVLDSTGNVIVTGYSIDSISAGDYLTIKYSNGGFPLWTNQYSGAGAFDDYAQAVAVDSSGNVIVTGYVTSSAGDYDYATIKCSSSGVPLWTNRYHGPGNDNDQAYAVVVDHSDNVIVTGSSHGDAADYDFLTIKYSSVGVALWTNRYNGPANGYDQAWSVAVDKSDNVIVTGGVSSEATGYDYVTIKYSSAGVALWTNRYNGPGNDYDDAYAVAVDGDDTVFVTGYSYSSAVSGDFATIAYSSTGAPLWTNHYNGPGNGEDYPSTSRSLAVVGTGSVVVAGQSRRGQHSEYATVKYVTAPRLDIRRTATNTVAVSWPSPSSGFQLRQNTNLAGTNWTTTSAPSDDGTNKTFLVNPPNGSRFYRLFYQ
ncbi:MAG TPA: SBBP repeat-containing protein, partial [Verrucomicrobiae bacterium]|nr:SBBP repeat-containing protein [Verrucomicrobiae bacterium]